MMEDGAKTNGNLQNNDETTMCTGKTMMDLTAALIQSAEENETLQVKNTVLINMIEELRSELSNKVAHSKKRQ